MSSAAVRVPISWWLSRSNGGLRGSKASGMATRAPPGSMCQRAGGADAGFRADELRLERRPFLPGLGAGIEPRDDPDAGEGDRHGEQRRVVVGEERGLEAERLHPHGR